MKINNKAFTLVELMVVVAIIAVVSVTGILTYRGYVRKAQSAEGVALLSAVAAAEKMYYADRNAYIQNTSLIDATENKYFRSYSFDSFAAATGFTLATSGTGDAANLRVTYRHTRGQPPVITITDNGRVIE